MRLGSKPIQRRLTSALSKLLSRKENSFWCSVQMQHAGFREGQALSDLADRVADVTVAKVKANLASAKQS